MRMVRAGDEDVRRRRTQVGHANSGRGNPQTSGTEDREDREDRHSDRMGREERRNAEPVRIRGQHINNRVLLHLCLLRRCGELGDHVAQPRADTRLMLVVMRFV